MHKLTLSEKSVNAFSAAVLFSATLFFFIPLSLFLANSLDFALSFSRVFLYSLVFFLALTLTFTVLLLFLRSSRQECAVSLVTGAGIFIWLKANIFVWDYGVWAGNRIDWSRYRLFGAVDIILLLSVAAVFFAGRRIFYRLARKITLALLMIQAVSLFFVLHYIPAPEIEQDYRLIRGFSGEFSREKNVIIILIDSFRGELFKKLMIEKPEYRRSFDGFTYYSGAVADSSLTWLSMLPIMTGKNYDPDYDFESYVRKVYNSRSLPAVLKQNGFRVEMYNCPTEKIYCAGNIAYNLVKRSKPGSLKTREELRMLYLTAFFRASPQFLKRYIHRRYLFPELAAGDEPSFFGFLPVADASENPGDSRDLRPAAVPVGMFQQVQLLRWIADNSRACVAGPVFKFFYFTGVHPPFYYDPQFNLRGVTGGGDCRGYSEQAEAWLGLTCKFLDRLKEAGAYDNSLIFVISDHGADLVPDCVAGFGDGPMQRANCLLAVKPFNSRGESRISAAPVQLSDIPKTVMAGLGLPDDFPGVSMFEPKPGRPLFHYRAGDRFSDWFGRKYFPELEIFRIEGSPWRRSSWSLVYDEKATRHKRWPLYLNHGKTDP